MSRLGRGLAGAVLCLLLAACAPARVVEQHEFPAESWGTGRSGRNLRVRVTSTGADCTLAGLARSHAVSDAVGGIVDERVRRDLATAEALFLAREVHASTAGREIAGAMAAIEARGAAGATDADLLRALNAVGAGLGAPRPFATVAEARAFLDGAAAR